MNRIELLNNINNVNFEDDEEKALTILNVLFENNYYKEYLDLVFALIKCTEMYGFTAYFSKDEYDKFLEWDTDRSQTYCGKNIPFYNRGQLSLLFELEKNKKVFLSAPTSFGKTSIVVEYLLSNYLGLNNIMFVVPTNSLLEELYQKLIRLNKQFNMNYKISTQPRLISGNRNLLLLTPERFFLVSEETNVNSFDCIIMDETYKIVDSKNESVSDFLESRALRFRKVADMIGSSNKRVIFLSPFTYQTTKSMEKFLNKYGIQKIDRKVEYVCREVFDVSNSKDFTNLFGKGTGYNKSLSQVKKTKFILDKLKSKKNIVYVSCYSDAYKIVDEIEWTNQSDDQRFKKFIEHLEKNYDIKEAHEWKIITALKKGIGIYVSPLPRYIKKEIIRLYEANILSTLIVTTSFTEGVNTNASNLIFTTLVNGPKTNKLSDIDVLNVAGRAGRFAKNSVGKIYCINNEVFNHVKKLQDNSNIALENYNYRLSYNRNDYELDMVEDEFLTQEDIDKKKEIENLIDSCGLSKNDLNISLNVSTKWKITLYKAINENNIKKLYENCTNILNDETNKRIDSLNLVFTFIRDAFESAQINPFPSKSYEIKAFDNSGDFIWSRLYKIYCAGSTKDIIKKNIAFISNAYKAALKNVYQTYNTKEELSLSSAFEGKNWILNYYTNDLKLNYDAFFTETFKFISSIVQYRIPFYVSFVASILNLYIKKHNLLSEFDVKKLNSKEYALLFEDGQNLGEYDNLIDFGISNDIILKMRLNNITIENLKQNLEDSTIFDDYEKIILNEFVEFM